MGSGLTMIDDMLCRYAWIFVRMGCQPFNSLGLRAVLGRRRFLFVGYGSLGRPISEALAFLGATEMTLVDPKSYSRNSVRSQCRLNEVGKRKTDMGLKILAPLAKVEAYPCDVYTVPEGVVSPNTLVVATVDNRRAEIRANRMALRMGAVLIKINIEPDWNTVAIRAFDFRGSVQHCAECQLTESQYQHQHHPVSCDAAAQGRPTNSPRWFSQAAASLGAVVIAKIAEEIAGSRWFGAEWLINLKTRNVVCSRLIANPDCRCDHAERWPNVQRLDEGPAKLRLRDLLGWQSIRAATARFCQRVAFRGRCLRCREDQEVIYWIDELDGEFGQCDQCAGAGHSSALLPVPFWTYSQVSLNRLRPVLNRSLADWGVPPAAVISISGDDGEKTYVIGSK